MPVRLQPRAPERPRGGTDQIRQHAVHSIQPPHARDGAALRGLQLLCLLQGNAGAPSERIISQEPSLSAQGDRAQASHLLVIHAYPDGVRLHAPSQASGALPWTHQRSPLAADFEKPRMRLLVRTVLDLFLGLAHPCIQVLLIRRRSGGVGAFASENPHPKQAEHSARPGGLPTLLAKMALLGGQRLLPRHTLERPQAEALQGALVAKEGHVKPGVQARGLAIAEQHVLRLGGVAKVVRCART
mmetsp:Transcript_22303/g.63800  ORF Transcript_22303/g.63800 Transcript_22303/m.63800 type:complete len:243 (+) Transcript_22303:1687-2415(+)